MTSEEPQWIPTHRETFERTLLEAEQEQRDMLALTARLAPGALREEWERKLVAMADRLRRQREDWARAVAEERARP